MHCVHSNRPESLRYFDTAAAHWRPENELPHYIPRYWYRFALHAPRRCWHWFGMIFSWFREYGVLRYLERWVLTQFDIAELLILPQSISLVAPSYYAATLKFHKFYYYQPLRIRPAILVCCHQFPPLHRLHGLTTKSRHCISLIIA
jgi:hypothetical protein